MAEEKNDKRPTHRAYVVVGNGDNSIWREIGAGWAHADSRGLNVKLDAVPITGSLVLRERRPEEDGGPEREDPPRAAERRDGPRMG